MLFRQDHKVSLVLTVASSFVTSRAFHLNISTPLALELKQEFLFCAACFSGNWRWKTNYPFVHHSWLSDKSEGTEWFDSSLPCSPRDVPGLVRGT